MINFTAKAFAWHKGLDVGQGQKLIYDLCSDALCRSFLQHPSFLLLLHPSIINVVQITDAELKKLVSEDDLQRIIEQLAEKMWAMYSMIDAIELFDMANVGDLPSRAWPPFRCLAQSPPHHVLDILVGRAELGSGHAAGE